MHWRAAPAEASAECSLAGTVRERAFGMPPALNPERSQRRFTPVVRRTLERFSAYIAGFSAIYVKAAKVRHGSREEWRTYMNELIDLFEDGEVRSSH
jgi:hypothetical protein